MSHSFKEEEKLAIDAEIERVLLRWSEYEGEIKEFAEMNSSLLRPLCRLLSVARIEITLNAPSSNLTPDGINNMEILNDPGKIPGNRPLVYNKTTFEGGSCVIMFYPYAGREFDNYTVSKLEFMATMVFMFGGRVRTRNLLKKALSSDQLTGLPNLNSFLAFMGMLIQRGRANFYNAYYLNVRNFKYINKLSDQRTGDECMAEYARKLSAIVDRDEIVSRLGGDNFVALIKRDENDAFLDAIKAIPVDVMTKSGPRTVMLGATVGVYEIPSDIRNPEDIMMPITVAHTIARQVLHKECVYYSESLASQFLISQRVLVNFKDALKKHEFEAYLQPKIDLSTGEVCGAEALARWNHHGEIIGPGDFIPPLERDGSICELDFEILRQSCEIIEGWKSKGLNPITVSVNLSRWHLEEPGTAEKILKTVKKYNFDHKYLEFEITESVDSREYEALTSLLAKLRESGFVTSIDDFGTGYSSITMLKDFELDILKLDRSFIAKIGDKTEGLKDRVLVSNVVNLAKQLDMQVLAEGVETEAQMKYLKKIGCDMIQGFLYSKPIPVNEFTKQYMKKD